MPEKYKSNFSIAIQAGIVALTFFLVWYVPPIMYDALQLKDHFIHTYYYLSIAVVLLIAGFVIPHLIASETLLVAGMGTTLWACWWWNNELTARTGYLVFVILMVLFFLGYYFKRRNIKAENLLYDILQTCLNAELTLMLVYTLAIYGISSQFFFYPSRLILYVYLLTVALVLYAGAWWLPNNMLAWVCINTSVAIPAGYLLVVSFFGARDYPSAFWIALVVAAGYIFISYHFFLKRRKKIAQQ